MLEQAPASGGVGDTERFVDSPQCKKCNDEVRIDVCSTRRVGRPLGTGGQIAANALEVGDCTAPSSGRIVVPGQPKIRAAAQRVGLGALLGCQQ
jgi:hypothetical protein